MSSPEPVDLVRVGALGFASSSALLWLPDPIWRMTDLSLKTEFLGVTSDIMVIIEAMSKRSVKEFIGSS